MSKKKAWTYISASMMLVALLFFLSKGVIGGSVFHFSLMKGLVIPEVGLQGSQIAEMLELSIDSLPSYNTFSNRKATQKFSSHPVIKKAKVRKRKGGWIEIDYEMRKPIALVSNFTNTAVDEEGVLFPYHPFYTPKTLPMVCLPLKSPNSDIWGKSIAKEEIDLVSSIFSLLSKEEKSTLRSLDISHFDEENLGREEIVLVLEKKGEKILRLNAKHYPEQWSNWRVLNDHLEEGNCIIDMRLLDLAFIIVD